MRVFEQEYYDQIENRLYYKASQNKIPLRGNFELTPRCSLSCKMCYVVMTAQQVKQSGRRELTTYEWLKLGEQACENGMLFLLLTGGEAMIRSDYKEIFTGLATMGISLDLNSNGTLFTPDMVEWFAKNPPSQINLTLYGGCNETYERMCGLPNGFDRVKTAIDNLLAANINVKLQATITPHNYMDVDKMIEFANERKLNAQMTGYTFPPRRRDGDDAVLDRLDAQTAARIDFKTRTQIWNAYPKFYFEKMVNDCENADQSKKTEPLQMSCRAGRSSFWITWDGTMIPCGLMDSVKAYPLKDGFNAAWKYIYEQTEKIYFPKECWGCEKMNICPSCPAMFYNENGDTNKCSSYLCDFAGHYLDCIKKYVKGE